MSGSLSQSFVTGGRTRAGLLLELEDVAIAEPEIVNCDNDRQIIYSMHHAAVAYLAIDGGRPTPLCARCLEAAINESSEWPMESYVVVEIKVKP